MSQHGAAAVPADHRDSELTALSPNRTRTRSGSTNAPTFGRGTVPSRGATPEAIGVLVGLVAREINHLPPVGSAAIAQTSDRYPRCLLSHGPLRGAPARPATQVGNRKKD
jgi:hypothetical protein